MLIQNFINTCTTVLILCQRIVTGLELGPCLIKRLLFPRSVPIFIISLKTYLGFKKFNVLGTLISGPVNMLVLA